MSEATIWYLIIGGLFTLIATFEYAVKKLPLTSSMVYLPIGFALGGSGFGLFALDPVAQGSFVERVSEIVVVLSLFTAGLKLRAPLNSPQWFPVFRLASLSMMVTIGLVAAFAAFVLGFSWGAAVLLGAVLAPTDPVLASDVQVRGPSDRDPLRFNLTGEAGFNDGMAFPFVLLGLGMLGLHEIGAYGLRWFAVDILWKVVAGLGVGWILGTAVARLILILRKKHQESAVLDDFLTIGLVCLSYGVALAIDSYGFLAAFTAGLALRRIERVHSSSSRKEAGPKSDSPPAKMAEAVLTFNEQLERIGEVATVILVGAMLQLSTFSTKDIWMLPVLFLVIRPVAVFLGFLGAKVPASHRAFISWFGIRGIGSIYYLSHAITLGLPEDPARRIANLVLVTVAASIVLHGFSVTPLMNAYQNRVKKLSPRKAPRGKD